MNILILTALAATGWAADATGGADIRYVDFMDNGNQETVREYDGRQRNFAYGDLWLKGNYGPGVLDLDLRELNSGNESGFLSLNIGDFFRWETSGNILTHRQALNKNGYVLNGTFVAFTEPSANFGGPIYIGQPLAFDRTAGQSRLILSLPGRPDYRLTAGFWGEAEKGDRPYSLSTTIGILRQRFDRTTVEPSVGVEADIGRGQVSYDYARRTFEDDAQGPVVSSATAGYRLSTTATTAPMWIFPKTTLDMHRVAVNYRVSEKVWVAAGATGRMRENTLTGYKSGSYHGHASASWRPSPTLSITGRAYARTTQEEENFNFSAFAAISSLPKERRIDYDSLKGDLKLRYTGIQDVTVKLGYKPEYTHRSHVPTDVYTSSAGYQDGLVVAANAHQTGVARSDFRQVFSAGADISLPFEADLDAEVRYATADRAVFEGTTRKSNEERASLTVPLPWNWTATAGWTRFDGENDKSSFVDFETLWTRYLAGVSWLSAGGKYILGANYEYETGEDTLDAFFGESNSKTFNIHERASFDTKNETASLSGTARLPLEFVVDGAGSYTMSSGRYPLLHLDDGFTGGSAGKRLSDMNPTKARIWRWNLGLRREITKHTWARVGYHWNDWDDKLNKENDGTFQLIELALGAKF